MWAKRVLVTSAFILMSVVSVSILGRHSVVLRECFRPTTVEMVPLPTGCVQTMEAPPSDLVRLLNQQKDFYHLKLQKTIVCRTQTRLIQNQLNAMISSEPHQDWLPLYIGCCSYQFHRHFLLLAARVDDSGSIVLAAAMIQSRWDYLRLNWSKA
jgi:hypothetical protein